MNAQSRAAWLLGAAALAALGLSMRAPDAAWIACALAAPAAGPGLREWAALRPRLAGLTLVAAGAAALDGQPAVAAAALVMASAGGVGPARGSLVAVAMGLAGAVWAVQGPPPAVAVMAAACAAAALLRVADVLADRALERAARGGVLASGHDALRVAAGIDGIVLAVADVGGPRSPATRPDRPAPAMAGPPAPPPLLRPPDMRARRQAAGTAPRRRPPRAAARHASSGLRALGCEVWSRGRVVPLRRRADEHVFAIADMLARGRRVAVVTGPGGVPPAGDLAVQAGGGLRQSVGPALVLPGADLGPLVEFLRLARRVRRTRAGLGLGAVLIGGPGVAWAAVGGMPATVAAWLAVGCAALLAAAGGGGAPIFTSSQRPYG